jgi:hypothetical protein
VGIDAANLAISMRRRLTEKLQRRGLRFSLFHSASEAVDQAWHS